MGKIILTDVDGTLVDYDGNIPESAVTAIRKARANGHRVYMVTGRSKAENSQEIWDIGFDGMIGGNGSYVEDNGNVVMHALITRSQCEHFVRWFKERNIEYYEESNNGLFASEHFVERGRTAVQKYAMGKGMNKRKAKKLDTKDVFHGLVEGAPLIRDDLNKVSFILNSYQDYLDAVEEFPDMKVGTWGGKDELALYGDLGVKNVDKQIAVRVLIDYLNGNIEDTIAIGDAAVDIGMIEFCQIGIAMGNASQQVKDAADYITDDVNSDGLYRAFEHFGLIK